MCANTTPGLKKGNKERSFLSSAVTVRRYIQWRFALIYHKNIIMAANINCKQTTVFILGWKPYTFL
jgi:hypothetical protein